MKKTILFDFDGVIADSFPVAFEVSKMNYPTLTLESYADKFKENISKAVYAEPKADIEVDFQHEYAKKIKVLGLDPAKKAVLERLSETYDFHIISSTNTETIKDYCELNGILNYFGDILGYDVEASKVKKFQMLFEKYRLDPKELIFVTDTTGDIEEAREAGIGTVIAVADGYQDQKILEASHPTHVIDSIKDLEKVLHKNFISSVV